MKEQKDIIPNRDMKMACEKLRGFIMSHLEHSNELRNALHKGLRISTLIDQCNWKELFSNTVWIGLVKKTSELGNLDDSMMTALKTVLKFQNVTTPQAD